MGAIQKRRKSFKVEAANNKLIIHNIKINKWIIIIMKVHRNS